MRRWWWRQQGAKSVFSEINHVPVPDPTERSEWTNPIPPFRGASQSPFVVCHGQQQDAWPQHDARLWCRGGGGIHDSIARELPYPAAHENTDATQISSLARTPVEAAL